MPQGFAQSKLRIGGELSRGRRIASSFITDLAASS